jgi:hypothetical protein
VAALIGGIDRWHLFEGTIIDRWLLLEGTITFRRHHSVVTSAAATALQKY